jgi:hypothetical protein
MKIGAENKKQLYIMLALMAIALFFLLRVFLSSDSPPRTVSASIPNAATPTEAGAQGRGRAKAAPPLDPTLRTDLLKNSEGSEYKGTGRNIFEAQATPAPIAKEKPAVVAQQGPIGPPPPPPPPPIPLKFFGFANKPGQQKSIFLVNGDNIFIGREGDIVNRRYKILRISSSEVEIQDVLDNHTETIRLTQG